MYQIREELISEKEFEVAIQVVRNSELNVRKTPLIQVSGERSAKNSR